MWVWTRAFGLTHLCRLSGAGLSHHQHDPVSSDELDDLVLALVHGQRAPEAVQLRRVPPARHHGDAVVYAAARSVPLTAAV